MGASRMEYGGNLYIGDTLPNKPFWAKLTSIDVTNTFYAWTQQIRTPTGFVDLPGGMFGTETIMPAVEPNDQKIPTLPSFALIQKLYLDPVKNWVYVVIYSFPISASPPPPPRTMPTYGVGQMGGIFSGPGSLPFTILLEHNGAGTWSVAGGVLTYTGISVSDATGVWLVEGDIHCLNQGDTTAPFDITGAVQVDGSTVREKRELLQAQPADWTGGVQGAFLGAPTDFLDIVLATLFVVTTASSAVSFGASVQQGVASTQPFIVSGGVTGNPRDSLIKATKLMDLF